jgi:DNA-binding response OmpR family regulator
MGKIVRALGAEDFIEKPFDIRDLLSRIGNVLEKMAA